MNTQPASTKTTDIFNKPVQRELKRVLEKVIIRILSAIISSLRLSRLQLRPPSHHPVCLHTALFRSI